MYNSTYIAMSACLLFYLIFVLAIRTAAVEERENVPPLAYIVSNSQDKEINGR